MAGFNRRTTMDRRRELPSKFMRVDQPTEIDIVANAYEYKGGPLTFYTYTVTFTPEVKKPLQQRKFTQICMHNNWSEQVSYDGLSTAVSMKKFEDQTLEMTTNFGEMRMSLVYRNTYKTNDAHEDPTGVRMCFDIIAKDFQRKTSHVDKKRIIAIDSPSSKFDTGLDLKVGITLNFLYAQSQWFANLDQAYGVFYTEQPLLDLVREIAHTNTRFGSLDNFTPELHASVEKFINKLKLRTIHRAEKNRTFTAVGLTKETSSTKMIEFEDGSRMSVREYFETHYAPLKRPEIPLVIFKGRNGNEIHMPMEVLVVAPMQKYSGRLNEVMTATMIKNAAMKPAERFRMIEEKARALRVLSNPVLSDYGMVFDTKMRNSRGLVLPAPRLLYKKVQSSEFVSKEVFNGSWNLRDVSAHTPVTFTKWKIFYFDASHQIPERILVRMAQLALNFGLDLFPWRDEQTSFRNLVEQQHVTSLNDFHSAAKESFNLVVLPDKNSIRYEEVKRCSETYGSGVVTQCILAKNIESLTQPAFVGNIVLKFNCKMGGKNWVLEKCVFSDKPTIVVGIDIAHPGASEVDSPSITAVVGSMDYDFVNYRTVIESQSSRAENVENLAVTMELMLKHHRASTGVIPLRIVVLRAGICDSSYDAALNYEIAKIKEACTNIDRSYSPEITYILAQTRQTIRFAMADSDGLSNVPPCTLVSDLTEGSIDFHLVPHSAIKGTARPVRYKVILNESNFSKEQIYEAMLEQSFLYAKATKAVGKAACLYYADLATARGHAYLETKVDDNGQMSTVLRSAKSVLLNRLFYI